MRYFLILICSFSWLFAAKNHFDLYKLETDNKSGVLLIVGGIHGNEPGSYYAPAIFINHYKITKGNVWVIPNLNRDSIIKFERGIYGDMNRKFAYIAPNDADMEIVGDVKKIITDKRVAMVLNLHDGHGFYRPKFVNSDMNPSAWGQATIIDQQKLDGVKYGELAEIAKKVTSKTSVITLDENHEFNVKNTQTKEKDKDMRQSLTFFAINSGKPAFGVETSKNINDLSVKVTYQLKAFEEFMNIMGIEYKRDFELNAKNIATILAQRGSVKISDKIDLPLDDIKSSVEHLPLDGNFSYVATNPNTTLFKDGKVIGVYSGFKKLSLISADVVTYDNSLKDVASLVDNKSTNVKIGTTVNVQKSIKFIKQNGFRLNVIGLSSKNTDESDIVIELKNLDKKYSVDNAGKIYRAEFYKDKAFCGMIMIKFN